MERSPAGAQPPDSLTPRLPWDFADYRPPEGYKDRVSPATQLIVVSGLPGTGKSVLADRLGRQLGIPVFSVDWLLGALTPFGFYGDKDALDVGAEMLTHLALRQLLLDQSVLLDHPCEEVATRRRWSSLATRFGARFKVIWCVCSDPDLHRSRVEGRHRAIPGWHDAGHWPNVVARRERYPAWAGDEVLRLDTATDTAVHPDEVRRFLDS